MFVCVLCFVFCVYVSFLLGYFFGVTNIISVRADWCCAYDVFVVYHPASGLQL
jgi:hypothetical protein